MKRKLLSILTLLTVFTISFQSLQSTPQGAPSDGRTGSPGDGGKTCYNAGCHFGSPNPTTGVLSSNVPVEGYTAGTTYTITVSLPYAGNKGFCVSPQKPDGTLMGSLTAGSGNSVSNTKYVTHTSPKTSNPGVWTFQWTAPAKGSGTVDFYGAFAATKFTTYTQKISIPEKNTTGISENSVLSKLSLYPNPVVSDVIHLGVELMKSAEINVSIMDMAGNEVVQFNKEFLNHGAHNLDFALPSLNNGIYFLRMEAAGQVLSKKLLVQQ